MESSVGIHLRPDPSAEAGDALAGTLVGSAAETSSANPAGPNMSLADIAIRALKPRATSFKFLDGDGLHLWVVSSGTKV
jgi:hypothetical protein